jgi:hypothetical protein
MLEGGDTVVQHAPDVAKNSGIIGGKCFKAGNKKRCRSIHDGSLGDGRIW